MMHQEVKVYVEDILAKSKKKEDHLQVLRKLFERLREFQLRLNPVKCLVRVKTRKLLDFMVSSQGIEVDLDKVKAIEDMSTLKIEKEVKSFLGRLNYIAWFIYQLTVTCKLIFRLLIKKNPRV
jgi:hypothetical protein